MKKIYKQLKLKKFVEIGTKQNFRYILLVNINVMIFCITITDNKKNYVYLAMFT